ncbi:MAG: bifunctional phosphoribosylaminoimidazolecarboxamide formyltransferase/IMP cyclohydrolase [Bacteroidetes bacterium]|jgi:phosphoribosylaminoimidazolecarboxamide formyltransferase/IMP cyclohydrolase|nr:bifunctional phosphoribosylaminoimidazolecarboxamide formyltransferase/IMP cyclohydrolase [Bacteroidota bacterium]
MSEQRKITNALISVFHKEGLESIIHKLDELGVKIYSTGGTREFIEDLGVRVNAVEEITSYPSILGGRVKTLHPKVFGGILARRHVEGDVQQLTDYDIPEFDLVLVDLYPFEETVASGADEESIIEKIDIGGISLIRAAAKNFKDVVIIPSKNQYDKLTNILNEQGGETEITERKELALEAFNVSSHYDTAIYNYFNSYFDKPTFKQSISDAKVLRYGENPHQAGTFFGKFDQLFEQYHGKEISYNNLLDIEAAVYLIDDFEETTFAILKHNNACGIASRDKMLEAYKDALAGDPISAFGGILITNDKIDSPTAEEMDKLFFEVVIAPAYDDDALEILKKKKNRIILLRKDTTLPTKQFRTLLNGVIVQDRDTSMERKNDMKLVTKKQPTTAEYEDLEFALKIVKHTKSNAIVLAKNKQLCASGTGQTSRIDALKQAIEKANHFKLNIEGAVMASDAFFPFSDSVEIASGGGIKTVIQPGGSVRDQESIDFCDQHDMAMVFTGIRHFKH